MASNPIRHAEITKIHVARSQLGMDEETYRQVIRDVGGARSGSSADLNSAGRARVLAHFKACGWKPRPTKGKQRRPPKDDQDAKILALWGELERLGVLRESADQALATYCKRQSGVERAFMRPGHKRQVIEALKQWVAREKRKGETQ